MDTETTAGCGLRTREFSLCSFVEPVIMCHIRTTFPAQRLCDLPSLLWVSSHSRGEGTPWPQALLGPVLATAAAVPGWVLLLPPRPIPGRCSATSHIFKKEEEIISAARTCLWNSQTCCGIPEAGQLRRENSRARRTPDDSFPCKFLHTHLYVPYFT